MLNRVIPSRRRTANAAPSGALEKSIVEISGLPIAYTEDGSGPPVVFIHGGVGSSYIWRKVMPKLAVETRCIAVDLIGTGDSGRSETPEIDPESRRAVSHDWLDQVAYVEAFLSAIDVTDDVVLVLHGWGSIVGLEWARANEHRVRGICHMEAITRPMAWPEFPESLRASIRRARSPDGRGYVMDSDECFAHLLQTQVLQPLRPAVRDEYWREFGEPGEPRRALLSALNLIPANGKPAESATLVKSVAAWFKETQIPKLLVLGEPGYLVTGRTRNLAERLPNQTVAHVPGIHLLPEESPEAISLFLSLWMNQIPVPGSSLDAQENSE